MKPLPLLLFLAIATVTAAGRDNRTADDYHRDQQRQMQLDLQAEQVRIQREQLELQREQQQGPSAFDQEVARRRNQRDERQEIQDLAIQSAIAEDKARRDFERQKELIRVRAQAEAQARAQAQAQADAQRRAELTRQERARHEQEARERLFIQRVEESYTRMGKRYPDFAEGGKHYEKFQEFLVKNAPATLGDMSQASFPEVYADKFAALIRVKPRE